jgi:hypothetical protein
MTACENSQRRKLGFLVALLAGALALSTLLDCSVGCRSDDIVNLIQNEEKAVSISPSVKLRNSGKGRDRTAM